MKVTVGVSNKHVHLSKMDYDLLFDEELTKRNDLKQPNNYASNQVVSIKTDKYTFDNVRVLGPLRDYTQVEVSKTDAIKLGINPPIRKSGDLIGSSTITIMSKKGSITKNCCIIPERHIHISYEMLKKYNWKESDIKKIVIDKYNGGILCDVHLKPSEDAFLELHINTDEANAFDIKSDDVLDIMD